MQFDPSTLITHALPDKDGYTWTYASRLGSMLEQLESLYGKRDASYTLLGIEFCDSHPQIWYPGNRKDIVIQLGVECIGKFTQGCYQLAHESVRLLSPVGHSQATVLEEGLATYFSGWYMREIMHELWYCTLESYKRAGQLVEQLLAIDRDAVRKLRAEQPIISKIDAKLILDHYPSISEQVAEQLSQRFDRAWQG